MVFNEAVEMLVSDSPKRITNALHTLCAILMAMYKKGSTVEGTELMNVFVREPEEKMKMLMQQCNTILQTTSDEAPRIYCLKLLLVLVAGTDNINNNLLLEYVMNNSFFDSMIKLLSDPLLRNIYGNDTVVLMTLLVNYRKHDGENLYVVKLSILADELALNGYGQVISGALTEFCKQYNAKGAEDEEVTSWFTSLSAIVGNMFVSDGIGHKAQQIRANNALLLALYEAVHLNKRFITTLAHTQTEVSAPPSPSNTLDHSRPIPDLSIESTQYPTNLFVALFQYCSIVMQDTKNEFSTTNLKLCFLILTCISEGKKTK